MKPTQITAGSASLFWLYANLQMRFNIGDLSCLSFSCNYPTLQQITRPDFLWKRDL